MKVVVVHALVVLGLLAAACAPAQPAQEAKPAAGAAPPAAAPAVPAQPAKPAAEKPAQPAAKKVQLTSGWEVDEALLQAAKREGKVAYWGSLREPEVKEIAKAFQDLTGITVESTRLSAGPQFTRISKEREAKLYTVDVVQHGGLGFWKLHKERKYVIPYMPEGAKKYDARYRDKDGYFLAFYIQANSLGYNSKLITGADVPKSYKDLADPNYKDKVATSHPKHSGTGGGLVIQLSELYGWSYYEKLKQNNLFIVRSQFELNPMATSGERPISLGVVDSSFLDDKAAGKPVDIVYAEDANSISWVASGVAADAPHPNAAKLFQEWLHSVAAQNKLTAWRYLVPHPDATYPAGRPPLSAIKNPMTLTADEVEKKLEPAQERFTDLFGGG
ncbi:MAG: extracellular solute-binding protein [Chloroflexi bacterium]|nr:extracellular solute-binding protein [Chloroflexota bacterium]